MKLKNSEKNPNYRINTIYRVIIKSNNIINIERCVIELKRFESGHFCL